MPREDAPSLGSLLALAIRGSASRSTPRLGMPRRPPSREAAASTAMLKAGAF